VANSRAATAEEIFGGIDAMKLHSSMTLFTRAGPDEAVFRQVLDRYFLGQPDPATDERLGHHQYLPAESGGPIGS
jgi:uncharacterized protein (DUF1810 family)